MGIVPIYQAGNKKGKKEIEKIGNVIQNQGVANFTRRVRRSEILFSVST